MSGPCLENLQQPSSPSSCINYVRSMSGESSATLQPFFTLQLDIQNEVKPFTFLTLPLSAFFYFLWTMPTSDKMTTIVISKTWWYLNMSSSPRAPIADIKTYTTSCIHLTKNIKDSFCYINCMWFTLLYLHICFIFRWLRVNLLSLFAVLSCHFC